VLVSILVVVGAVLFGAIATGAEQSRQRAAKSGPQPDRATPGPGIETARAKLREIRRDLEATAALRREFEARPRAALSDAGPDQPRFVRVGHGDAQHLTTTAQIPSRLRAIWTVRVRPRPGSAGVDESHRA
jgi:hypothetical protein